MNFYTRGVLNMNKSTIIGTVPAASELHKVPGFDPMKHLHKAVNAQGQPVMRLEPQYQRLWFRLACPKGRMLLNPLRITDQLAIFEAKVFFHRDDPTPASSFTSNKTAQETPNYIRAAQDEALKEALDNAGFGIQLCDVTQAASGSVERGPSVPPAQARVNEPVAEEQTAPPVQNVQPSVREAPAAPVPVEIHAAPQPEPVTQPTSSVQAESAPAAEEPAPAPQPAPSVQEVAPVSPPVAQEAPAAEPDPVENAAAQTAPVLAPQDTDVSGNNQSSVLTMLNFAAPAAQPEPVAPKDPAENAVILPGSAGTTVVEQGKETPAQAEPGYTDETPMEEILQLMTMEEAKAVMAPNGTCTGWTMGQVAERRPSSLRFFLTAFCKCGNIRKAAATLLIQDLEQKKAG